MVSGGRTSLKRKRSVQKSKNNQNSNTVVNNTDVDPNNDEIELTETGSKRKPRVSLQERRDAFVLHINVSINKFFETVIKKINNKIN